MCDGEHAQFRKPNWLRLGRTSHRRCGFQHRAEMSVTPRAWALVSMPYRSGGFKPVRSGDGWRVLRRAGEDCSTGSPICLSADRRSSLPWSRAAARNVENELKPGSGLPLMVLTKEYLQVTTAFVRIPIADIRTQSALEVSAAPIRTIPSV